MGSSTGGGVPLLLQTLKRTSTAQKRSVLKTFRSVSKTFHFVLKCFIPSPKRSVSFSKRFVPYKPFKSFRSKRSVQSVFGSFYCHYQNGKFTMKMKTLPFIWRITLLFHISRLVLWNCFDLQDNVEF